MRMLSVDQAKLRSGQLRGVERGRFGLDRLDLREIGIRHEAKSFEHPRRRVARIARDPANVGRRLRPRVDRRDRGAAPVGYEYLQRTAQVRADLEVGEL